MPDGTLRIAPGGSTIQAPLPAPPVRQYSFTDNSTNNPTSQQPGDRMDAEYDRSNGAVSTLITFCSVTFNTDGSLRPGSVGQAQLDPNIVNNIVASIEAQLQVFVDSAAASAGSAESSAELAGNAQTVCTQISIICQAASQAAQSSARDASTSASTALTASGDALLAQGRAEDAANTAGGNQAYCEDYSLVCQAWAEYMPDTIPPNILAVMNITGDHWSSRWWANYASEIVSAADASIDQSAQDWIDQINSIGTSWITSFQSLYLGAFYSSPTTDAFGNPVAIGAVYYNLILQAPYVWNGVSWVPLITPSPSQIYKYIYVSAANQTTYSGPDRNGNVLVYNAANRQQISVYHKGILLTPVDDYTEAVNSITLHAPSATGDIVQLHVEAVPEISLDWTTFKLDTSHWITTGGTLIDMQGNPVTPAAASDVFVSVNGVWQDAVRDYVVSSNILTFITPIESDAVTFGLAIVPVQSSTTPVPAVTKLDTSTWVFDGVATNFMLRDGSGNPIDPITAVDILIAINGVWQEAITDYVVTPGNIMFSVPPEPGALAFGIAGLPSFVSQG